MTQVILGPTPVAQWYELITEAESTCSIKLGEQVESYLVFMLMRFLQKPDIAHSTLALEFLENIERVGSHRLDHLRDVGDKCLLFSGFFPARARRKRVSVTYFVRLGQTAYQTLADQTGKNWAVLYSALTQQFIPMMDILQTIRDGAQKDPSLTPMEALSLWEETASRHAYKALKKYAGGMDVLKVEGKRHC